MIPQRRLDRIIAALIARLVAARRIAVILAGAPALLGGCATPPDYNPTGALTHAISGRFHVLLGSPPRVDEACRSVGIDAVAGQRVRGCYLKAGDAHFMWISQDLDEAETIAHEWRHSIEGAWHP
jgi:hypothetical protein